MQYFIDLQVLPDPEFRPDVLMSELYEKIHLALVDRAEKTVGLSFPDFEPAQGRKLATFGCRLRLHGSDDNLKQLMANRWLTRISDFVRVGSIEPVPEKVDYRTVRRLQPKTNAARLRRRYVKRHSVPLEEAVKLIPDAVERRVRAPSLKVRSRSTRQVFHLFVEHGEISREPVAGEFSTYDLSSKATIPWF